MSRVKKLAALALCVLAPASFAWAASFPRVEVQIQSRAQTHRIRAELAVTQAQREQGLMGRKSLAPDAGMLFLFEDDRVASMWMHDTKIPLDMLFLSADGTIDSVAARAAPLSDRIISSQRPVRGVLELPAGAAERLGLSPGDRVTAPSLTVPLGRAPGSALPKSPPLR